MSWYAEKMQHRIVNLNMQNIQVFAKETCSWSAKDIYFKIYIEFRSFGGICCAGILTLQKKVWWPRQTKLLVGFGLLFFLNWCWWVFTGFRRFFDGLWRSCFIKNLAKPVFFSETSSKPGFDTSTRFFQGFGWCRI